MTFEHPVRSPTFYPIRWIENFLISLARDPETTKFYHDYMTVRWAVRVMPGIRPRTLHRAFDKLVARHEPLRLRFVDTKEGWKSEVLPKHPVGLIVEDLGPMSKDEQQAIVTERVRRPLTALSDALFEMRLLRFGRSGDVIMMRANHAIIDGYSVALLVEELLKHVMNLPVGPAPLSYGQFVAFQQKKARDRAADSAQFWAQMLLPPPQNLNIGRAAKGLGRMGPGTVQQPLCCDAVLGRADSDRVNALCQATGASAFAVLHTAFSETLCAIAGQDTVLINSIFGRNDAALASYIGPSIEVAPLRYVSTGAGLHQTITDVAHKITSISQHLPTDVLREDGEILQTLEAAGVSFDRFWVLAPLPTGRLKSSPLGKLFEKAMRGSLSLGQFSLEPVTIPSLAPTDAEMEFTITPADAGYKAVLYADAAGYDLGDLETIADGIRMRLAQA